MSASFTAFTVTWSVSIAIGSFSDGKRNDALIVPLYYVLSSLVGRASI